MGGTASAPCHDGGAVEADAASRRPSDRAEVAKRRIEVYYREFFTRHRARLARAAQLDELCLSEEQRRIALREQFLRELEYLRERRKPMSVSDFEVLKKIGQGGFGEVFLVRMRATGDLYALKKIPKEFMLRKRQVNHVWLERFVLATVGHHPNVVKMYYSFQDRTHLYFVMEYLPGGDLFTMLRRVRYLSEEWARFYIAEIIVAIDALHRTGIIHRDVKPENIIFGAHGHIRLSDFGLSKSLFHATPAAADAANVVAAASPHTVPFVTRSTRAPSVGADTEAESAVPDARSTIESARRGPVRMWDIPISERIEGWRQVAAHCHLSAVGSPDYIAPEVLQERSYSESVDWWSVGVMLFEMLVGYPPFMKTDIDTETKILFWNRYLEFPERDYGVPEVSRDAEDLIRKLVCEPETRLGGTRGIEEFKEHPFFKGVQWDILDKMRAPFQPELESETDTQYFDEFDERENPDNVSIQAGFIDDDTSSVSQGTTPSGTSAQQVASAQKQNSDENTKRSDPSHLRLLSSAINIGRPRGTHRLDYAGRNVNPEFVGFTYMPEVHVSRRRIDPDMFRPPAAQSAPSATHIPGIDSTLLLSDRPAESLRPESIETTYFRASEAPVSRNQRAIGTSGHRWRHTNGAAGPTIVDEDTDTDEFSDNEDGADDGDDRDEDDEDEDINVNLPNENYADIGWNVFPGEVADDSDLAPSADALDMSETESEDDLVELTRRRLRSPEHASETDSEDSNLDAGAHEQTTNHNDIRTANLSENFVSAQRYLNTTAPAFEFAPKALADECTTAPPKEEGNANGSISYSNLIANAGKTASSSVGVRFSERSGSKLSPQYLGSSMGESLRAHLVSSRSSPEYLDRDLNEELKTELTTLTHPGAGVEVAERAQDSHRRSPPSQSEREIIPDVSQRIMSESREEVPMPTGANWCDSDAPSDGGTVVIGADDYEYDEEDNNSGGLSRGQRLELLGGAFPIGLRRDVPGELNHATLDMLDDARDVGVFEHRSIEVPSTKEVSSFVSEAMAQVRGAAAELDRPATDLRSFVDSVTSELTGSAAELNKSIASASVLENAEKG